MTQTVKFIRIEPQPKPVAVLAGPPVHEYRVTPYGPVSITSNRFRLSEAELRRRIVEGQDTGELRRALAALEAAGDFPDGEVVVGNPDN